MERQHAIVLGGSVAGLLTARVLADHFRSVTLMERDCFPDRPQLRKGNTHGSHLHVLLLRGLELIERLFPGLRGEMLANGAVPVDIGEDLAWLTPAGWAPRYKSGLVMLAFGRELLDYLLVERVRRLRNLTIQDGTGVNGLTEWKADLIVDATGRGSRLPLWLRDLGYEPPEELRVSAKLGYASRYYEAVAAPSKAVYIQANPPVSMRAGVLFPIGGNRWVATMAGGNGEYPPVDEDGFLEFTCSLASPVIYDALRSARPLSPVVPYRATDNRWRQYHRLKRHPDGVLAIGDSICAFNPVYGQGMTVAAECAFVLDECLRRRPREFCRTFYTKSARIILKTAVRP